jgi:hypothetical protein
MDSEVEDHIAVSDTYVVMRSCRYLMNKKLKKRRRWWTLTLSKSGRLGFQNSRSFSNRSRNSAVPSLENSIKRRFEHGERKWSKCSNYLTVWGSAVD